MKDEIKEILELYKNDDIEYYNLVSDLGYDKLLDYITNLQEKYEKMKENAEILSKGYNDLEKRNEKAIEFNQIVLDSDYIYSQDEIAQKNLNILNGGE